MNNKSSKWYLYLIFTRRIYSDAQFDPETILVYYDHNDALYSSDVLLIDLFHLSDKWLIYTCLIIVTQLYHLSGRKSLLSTDCLTLTTNDWSTIFIGWINWPVLLAWQTTDLHYSFNYDYIPSDGENLIVEATNKLWINYFNNLFFKNNIE